MIIAILWYGTFAQAMGQVCCVQYVQWPVHVYCSVQADCTGLPDLDPRETPRYLGGQRNSQGLNLKRGAERGEVDCENMSLEKIQSVQHCDASFKFDNF